MQRAQKRASSQPSHVWRSWCAHQTGIFPACDPVPGPGTEYTCVPVPFLAERRRRRRPCRVRSVARTHTHTVVAFRPRSSWASVISYGIEQQAAAAAAPPPALTMQIRRMVSVQHIQRPGYAHWSLRRRLARAAPTLCTTLAKCACGAAPASARRRLRRRRFFAACTSTVDVSVRANGRSCRLSGRGHKT
jgi:hypothetical protein